MAEHVLGSLSKLPYEIRLEIWDYVLQLEVQGPWKKEQLGILRANRAIYDEITSRSFDTIDVHIVPSVDEWTTVSPRRSSHSAVSYKEYSFCHFPLEKANLSIHLYAPDPQDPGQLLSLYSKVDNLFYIIDYEVLSFQHINLIFHQYQGIDWHCDGTANKSVKYPRGRPDHHVVFIPFIARLDDVNSMQIIPSGRRMNRAVQRGFLEYGRDFIVNNAGQQQGNVSTYSRDPKYSTIARLFDNTQLLRVDMEFFLDTELDHLPGHTADMLRLKRFATWFDEGNWGSSRYTSKFTQDIHCFPKLCSKYDPGLSKLLNRYRILIMTAHVAIEAGPTPRGYWRQRNWYAQFPTGLPPLSQPVLVREGYLASTWGAYAGRDRLPPRFNMDYIIAMDWRARRWPKRYRAFHPQFLGVFQPYCKDCETAGLFKTMTCCEQCERMHQSFGKFLEWIKS